MKLLDRLFGSRPREGSPPAVALPQLLADLGAILEDLAGRAPDPDVVCAKLADTLRELGVAPVAPDAVAALTAPLDDEGWARLALLTVAARRGSLGEALPALVAAKGADEAVSAGFVGVAIGSPLLTVELLRASRLRLEELARRWIAALGAEVVGERPEVSRAALERLDYGRLLDEVARAKMSAEERVAYLKKLQDERFGDGPRRGKW